MQTANEETSDRETIPTAGIIVNDDQPKTKAEIAAWMRVTTRTVERYMREGMPYMKVGRTRFHLPSVIAYLTSTQQK